MTHHTHLPSLGDHYSQLLGLVAPWTIADIDLNVEKATLDIHVVEKDIATLPCPECGTASRRYDHAPVRHWRHLDTMQFTTEIVVLLGTSNITRAMTLLKIGWDSAQAIRERAVERGMVRRQEESIEYAGIDEKSFLKGHKYASLMTDLERGRVLDIVQDRTKESAQLLIKTALSREQLLGVKAAAMDMWRPFMDSWQEASTAPIVHDKFHISGYLGEAVDAVRRRENRTLLKEGDETLKGARYLFLKNELEGDEKTRFRSLMKEELKAGRAWALKEAFRHFWDFVRQSAARSFFDRWYFRATHSRLEPLIKVAKMLKRHLAGLLAHCAHDITNAVTEGLNSKIQSIKSSARGFRNFAHYRIAILFFCGKLDMRPL